MKGTIMKGIAGFYYVKTEQQTVYQCKARGIFKKDGIMPYVGDEVLIEVTDDIDQEAVINEILPRKNTFIRPPIANVDCMIVVMALANPQPNLLLLDKFLVMAEKARTEIVICLNKKDLDEDGRLDAIKGIYATLYPVVAVSGRMGEGKEQLISYITGKRSALAGPSGVGKSTILNLLHEEAAAETGEVGKKSKRGKHTTKHVEIFEPDFGGQIFDTPGFTSFDVLEADEDELQHLYPEMAALLGQCKYDNCRHMKEPGCRIRAAVEEGLIHPSRYDSYTAFYNEILEKRKNYYD